MAGLVDDAHHVIRYLCSEEARISHRIDPRQIVLVGHSVGAWVALIAAAADAKIHCPASLDGYNLGKVESLMQTDAQEKDDMIRFLVQTTDPDSEPIRASAQDLAPQLMGNPAAFDLAQQAKALQDNTVLLLSGFHDDVAKPAQHIQPLEEAFRAAGMDGLTVKVLKNGDHAASADRNALTRTLLRWLRKDCQLVEW
jgi:dienelactone hydrolase